MIKNKDDAINFMNDLKESRKILLYSTDNSDNYISYDKQSKQWKRKINAVNMNIGSNGYVTESVIIEQIFIDRKFINKLIKA